jgi:hypothetical protein
LLGITPAAFAQNAWEKTIAPGMVYRMEFDPSTPRVIHAVRLTMRSPVVKISAALAGATVIGDGPTQGRGTVSQMVAENGSIGGINADYFVPNGDPLGLMVRDGMLLSDSWSTRSLFAWGASALSFGVAKFDGRIATADGRAFKLDGINRACAKDELVLSNAFVGNPMLKPDTVAAVLSAPSTGLPPSGRIVATVDHLVADGSVRFVPKDKLLITASGTRAEELLSLRPNDELRIELRTTGFDWNRVQNAVGGGPKLVSGGKVDIPWQAEGFNDSHTNKRHPRTAVGVTASGELWFVVVDGRQTMSAGATLPEMAQIMARLGCREALNLDGGGSSALNLYGMTLNRPSDGKERAVANGILFQSSGTKPAAGRTYSMKVEANRVTLFDSAGAPVPNIDVLWSATGDAWIDQGGVLHWIRPGRVTVSSWANGVSMSTDYVSAPSPPKAGGSASKVTQSLRSG